MAEHDDVRETRIRQRLIEKAVELLGQGALPKDLLAASAHAAGYTLDQTRRHFQSGEEIVLALYLRLAADLADRAVDIPEGTLASRFRAAMAAKVEILAPYRAAISALLPALRQPNNQLSVFSAQTEIVRQRVMAVLSTVVYGATDCPSSTSVDDVVRALYAVHLGLMYQWSQDTSADTMTTRAAVDKWTERIDQLSGRLDTQAIGAIMSVAGRAFERIVFAEPPAAAFDVADNALLTLFNHRRMPEPHTPCRECLAPHRSMAARSASRSEPLQLILPAFPAKSPSPLKVLGMMPDKAEEIALRYLQDTCDKIDRVYPAGVRLTICSDGHVFSDLVGVDDDVVTAYGVAIAELIRNMGLPSIDTFNMSDVFDGGDYHAMRDALCRYYAEPLEAIVDRCQSTPSGTSLFNGIHRFLVEDRAGVEVEKLKTQLRKEAKERTYEVIRRSDAWGRLLSDCFPTSIRLSIHPHPPHSSKIGVLLGDADDVWMTPWHSAAVRRADGSFTLMHRNVAEEQGARIVHEDGRPYYLEI